MKKYKLLKDLPDCKAGTILTKDCNKYYYTDNYDNEQSFYIEKIVENNPEWFEEVVEEYGLDEIINSKYEIDLLRKKLIVWHNKEVIKQKIELLRELLGKSVLGIYGISADIIKSKISELERAKP